MKYKLTTFISIGALVMFSIGVKAQVQDMVSILKPDKDQGISISDDVMLEWTMADDGQSQESIDFEISLSPNSCTKEINPIDIIATDDNNYDIEGNTFTYNYKWSVSDSNARKPLADGKYCVQICGTLLNESGELYGLCDSKDINITFADVPEVKVDAVDNNFPEIISTPTILNIKTGNKFSYQLEAKDIDGDKLFYSMSIGPGFLGIDPDTGILSSVGGLTTEGLYEVKLIVQDNNGGWDEQLFIIKISDKPFYELEFVEPSKYSKDIKGNTKVDWAISPETNIDNIILSYTKDGIEWVDFITLESDARSYDLDISALSGKYYLKLLVASSNGELYEVISDRFTIEAADGASDEIAISIKYPKKDTLIAEANPAIEANIIPSAGATLSAENITLTLDDTVLNCTYVDTLLSCKTEEALINGSHSIKLEVKDSLDKTSSIEWQFEVGDQIETASGGASKNSIYLGIGVFCLVLILLLGGWTAYYIYQRRKKNALIQDAGGDVNINYGSDPSMDSYSNPPEVDYVANDYTGVSDNSSTEFVPEIGEQSLGDTSDVDNYGIATPTDQSSPIETESVGELSMPSSYSNEEIPEWLKDFESDQPVSSTGSDYMSEQNTVNEGAKVHDDYGIALNSDDGDSSKPV